jgi:branched-subunit amino acid aminotransferase/4-amino-4-deoxychorismate lyase
MIVFLNGQFVSEAKAVVPINDRGFMYGDGLFETMRVVEGKPFRMAQHFERMVRGAEFLRIKLPHTPKEMQRLAEELIEKNQMPDAILRVVLTRGPGARGYSPADAGPPTLVMSLHATPPQATDTQMSWSLVTSPFRIPASDVLASFKTTSKILHVMARADATERGGRRDGHWQPILGLSGQNLHGAHWPRCVAGHHPRGGSRNLPELGFADEQTRDQTGGFAKFRWHFCHPKRLGNRAHCCI